MDIKKVTSYMTLISMLIMGTMVQGEDIIVQKNYGWLDDSLISLDSNSPYINQYEWGDPGIMNTTSFNLTTLVHPALPDFEQWNGTTVYYRLYCDYGGWNAPTKVMIYLLNSSYTHTEVNWMNRSDGVQWITPGGDYNRTELDNITASGTQFTAWGYFEFDVTSFVWDVHNGSLTTKYGLDGFYGFLILSEQTAGGWARFSEKNHGWRIIYPGPQGEVSTTIKNNQWTWMGYLNETNRTGEEIYNEISHCLYLCMYDPSSNYYYTYGPGIEEDFNVTYGSAVAILATSETYWDHK